MRDRIAGLDHYHESIDMSYSARLAREPRPAQRVTTKADGSLELWLDDIRWTATPSNDVHHGAAGTLAIASVLIVRENGNDEDYQQAQYVLYVHAGADDGSHAQWHNDQGDDFYDGPPQLLWRAIWTNLTNQ